MEVNQQNSVLRAWIKIAQGVMGEEKKDAKSNWESH